MSRSNQLAGLLTADPPSALDTINEINTALGNDASLSTTLTNSIATKAPKDSPTFTGDAVFDTDTLKVDATNNRVGIGTTSPFCALTNTNANPTAGTLSADSMCWAINQGTYTATLNNEHASGSGLRIQTNGSSAYALAIYDDSLADWIMVARGDGNVGIGTASPSTPIEVVNTSFTSSITGGKLRHGTTFQIQDSGSNLAQVVAYSEIDKAAQFGVQRNKTSGSYNDAWVMGMAENSPNWRLAKDTLGTALTVDTSGNVGIGTAPSSILHVDEGSGTSGFLFDSGLRRLKIVGSNSDGGYVSLETTDQDGSNASSRNLILEPNGGKVGIGTTSPSNKLTLLVASGDGLRMDVDENNAFRTAIVPVSTSGSHTGYLDFRTVPNAGGSPTSRMVILSESGNVGIGKSNPAVPLDVNGSANFSGRITVGSVGSGGGVSQGYQFSGDGNTGMYQDAYDQIQFSTNGSERMRINSSGVVKVNETAQLTYEQYSHSTSSFASNGSWHTMLSGLNDHKVFLVRMYQAGGGFHTSALFIAANTYASGNIYSFSSGSGWGSNIELRWTGTTYSYNLEGRSTGTNSANTYWRAKLINI